MCGSEESRSRAEAVCKAAGEEFGERRRGRAKAEQTKATQAAEQSKAKQSKVARYSCCTSAVACGGVREQRERNLVQYNYCSCPPVR